MRGNFATKIAEISSNSGDKRKEIIIKIGPRRNVSEVKHQCIGACAGRRCLRLAASCAWKRRIGEIRRGISREILRPPCDQEAGGDARSMATYNSCRAYLQPIKNHERNRRAENVRARRKPLRSATARCVAKSRQNRVSLRPASARGNSSVLLAALYR